MFIVLYWGQADRQLTWMAFRNAVARKNQDRISDKAVFWRVPEMDQIFRVILTSLFQRDILPPLNLISAIVVGWSVFSKTK